MRVCRVDPLVDSRWDAFVERHPSGSVFHTTAWMKALRLTYRYEPVVYALENQTQLVGGIPFCIVRSRITGRRLVSLPFSDYCQPLISNEAELEELIAAAEQDARRERFKYVEIRPLVLQATTLAKSNSVVVHSLDISRSEADLLKSFHGDCIRRKISRIEHEELRYEEGRSAELLGMFYRLLLPTRRRHRIPPQPIDWFQNVIDCLGEGVTIRVALKDDRPIASVLNLSFKNTLVNKYNCSDPTFKTVPATILLHWKAIQAAKACGIVEFNLGRSDYDNPGLIAFKDHWGAARIPVNYYRCPAPHPQSESNSRLAGAAKRLLVSVPDPLFVAFGRLMYRHVG